MERLKDNLPAASTSGGKIDAALVLSPRQKDVLRLASRGLRMRESSVELGVSVKTIESHRRRLLSRLGVSTVKEALVRVSISEDSPDNTIREPLTRRETEVLQGLVSGTEQQVALSLGISERTVGHHSENVRGKLGAATSAHAVSIGMQLGILADGANFPFQPQPDNEQKIDELAEALSQPLKVLLFSALGYSVKQLGEILEISPKTVESHLERVRRDYESAPSTLRAVLQALLAGDLPVDKLRQTITSQNTPEGKTVYDSLENNVQLTPREKDVLIHAALGNSAKETAAILRISPRTVEHQRAAVLRRLEVSNMKAAFIKALALGLISLDFFRKLSEEKQKKY